MRYGFGLQYDLTDDFRNSSAVLFEYSYSNLGKKNFTRSSTSYTYDMNNSVLSLGYVKFF